MKKLFLLGLVSLSLLSGQALQQGERDRAMSHMHVTRKLFLDSLTGVTPQQWGWKPSPGVWSIAEVAEHVAVSEETLFALVTQIMAMPLDPTKLAETAGKDDAVLKAMVDRSTKAQAPEMLRPTNRWKTKEELIAAFKQRRDRNIEYIQTTQDGLRQHSAPHPVFKTLDAYQWLLLISGHSERHTLQLNEVKTLPGFPK